MCPACLATLGVYFAATTGAGAVSTLVVRKFRGIRSKQGAAASSAPKPTGEPAK
jgi:hypothetical protein